MPEIRKPPSNNDPPTHMTVTKLEKSRNWACELTNEINDEQTRTAKVPKRLQHPETNPTGHNKAKRDPPTTIPTVYRRKKHHIPQHFRFQKSGLHNRHTPRSRPNNHNQQGRTTGLRRTLLSNNAPCTHKSRTHYHINATTNNYAQDSNTDQSTNNDAPAAQQRRKENGST